MGGEVYERSGTPSHPQVSTYYIGWLVLDSQNSSRKSSFNQISIEAHMIKNQKSSTSMAVRGLTAKYRWVLSEKSNKHNCFNTKANLPF